MTTGVIITTTPGSKTVQASDSSGGQVIRVAPGQSGTVWIHGTVQVQVHEVENDNVNAVDPT